MSLSHHCRDFWGREHRPLEQSSPNLALQLPTGPALLGRHSQIEFALLESLGLAQDDDVMRPRQLSQQCRDNFVFLIGLIEKLHAKEVRAREAANTRLLQGDVAGQAVYCAFTPFGRGYPSADHLPDLPVEIDKG